MVNGFYELLWEYLKNKAILIRAFPPHIGQHVLDEDQ